MPRLFLSNFEFELSLTNPGYCISTSLRNLFQTLAWAWWPVLEDGDYLLVFSLPDGDFLQTRWESGWPRVKPITHPKQAHQVTEVVPWGWTENARRLAHTFVPSQLWPEPAVIKQVNSRLWSFRLEQETASGLEAARACSTVDDVIAACKNCGALSNQRRWVIKANYGMSGRERLIGKDSPCPNTIRWVQSRLAQDEVIFVEPWVRRYAEAGFLWHIPPRGNGAPRWLGAYPMCTSQRGQYRGSWFRFPLHDTEQTPVMHAQSAQQALNDLSFPEEILFDFGTLVMNAKAAEEITYLAACRAQALGYFGPMGIDVMWYLDSVGELRCRPLQDINARWTMGRLAAGWSRIYPQGTFGLCWQGPLSERPHVTRQRTPFWQCLDVSPTSQSSKPDYNVSLFLR